jgi:transmembrane sensor
VNQKLLWRQSDKGGALFHLSKDATHPFVVKASGGSVKAVGTRFDVDRQPRRVRVGVTEGEVNVFLGGQAVALKVTQQLDCGHLMFSHA